MTDDTSESRTTDGVVPDDEMDGLRVNVFSACRDGDFCRLRSLVDSMSKDELLSIVKSTTNGASCLIIACRNGHTQVVSYLVTGCHADIQQVGSVTFDGEVLTTVCSAILTVLCTH